MEELQLLVNVEARILDLLKNHPLMPPSLNVRPYAEALRDAGTTTSVDNLTVRFKNTTYMTDSYNKDSFSLRATHSWEVMLEIRDLRGHTPILQLLPTITFLLSGLDVGTNKPLRPTNSSWAQFDENNFRIYTMGFSHEELVCAMPYYDPYEAPPECDDCFNGVTDRGVNICWRREYDRSAGRTRFFNYCAREEGITPGDYPRRKFRINVGIWRNTADVIDGMRSKDPRGVPFAVIPYRSPGENRTPIVENFVPEDPLAVVFPTMFITANNGEPITEIETPLVLNLFLSDVADTTTVVKITQLGSDNPELYTGFELGTDGEKVVEYTPAYNVDPGFYIITLRVEVTSGWVRLPNGVDYIDVEFPIHVQQ